MDTQQTLWEELCFPVNAANLRIRSDQIRARLQMFPVIVSSQIAVELLFVGLLWDQGAPRALLMWLMAIFTMHAVELSEWWRFRTETETVAHCQSWRRRFTRGAAVIGMLWGLGIFAFYPAELAYQAFLMCVALGLGAGAVTVNPVFPPSLYTFIPSVVLPAALRTALEGDALHLILAGMLLMFLFIALNSGRQLGATFYTSLWRRYENAELVKQLTAEKIKAETASTEKSRFLAAASHDLRQPMQALVLFSDALQETAKDREVLRLSGQINKSVDALVRMFDELLDVSKLDAGVIEVRWQSFDMQAMFDRMFAEFAPQAHAKGLGFDMPLGVWLVHSDAFLLERLLRNLISNAIRYTDAGEVSVRCEIVAEGVRLTVSDSGIGISEQALPHIFDEYFQAGNPHRDRRKGLGLGLAIVRRIAQLLDYRIEVDSRIGRGSTFSVLLKQGDAAQLVQPFLGGVAECDLAGKVVAFIEDDPDIRQVVTELMGDWGCQVIAGENPADVIRSLDARRLIPDLLICDYRLPFGMTAVQAIQQVRESGWSMPVVVLTGDTGSDVLQSIRQTGATLLHKPIAPTRLQVMMCIALTSRL